MRQLLLALFVCAIPAPAFGSATIVINNLNAPGVGFNDPTPAEPIGGNPGTTLGEQRLIAFQAAADLWGARLDSAVPIIIDATFEPLTCTATTAVLGSAGPLSAASDFLGALLPETWYHAALANRLAGVDLDDTVADLRARFNSELGQPGCLDGGGWYLGLDNNHGPLTDLITVLLHEFGHGMGFSTFVDRTTGEEFLGLKDIYEVFLFDNTVEKSWPDMTPGERAASSINPRQVVWSGRNVSADVPGTLAAGTPALVVSEPLSIAGEHLVGTASFGPQPTAEGVTAEIALGSDGVGVTTDACEPIQADLGGKLALVDRGTCGFTVKVRNAQDAGAAGVLVADNVAGSPPAGLVGLDPSVAIPSARVTIDTGNAIRAALAGGPVVASLLLDLSRRSGADEQDRVMVFTPTPLVPGSSVSHWDTSAFANLLMEPAINADLPHDVDLTLPHFRDIGWLPE